MVFSKIKSLKDEICKTSNIDDELIKNLEKFEEIYTTFKDLKDFEKEMIPNRSFIIAELDTKISNIIDLFNKYIKNELDLMTNNCNLQKNNNICIFNNEIISSIASFELENEKISKNFEENDHLRNIINLIKYSQSKEILKIIYPNSILIK